MSRDSTKTPRWLRDELRRPCIPTLLAIGFIAAGLFLDETLLVAVASAATGVAFALSVDLWWSRVEDEIDPVPEEVRSTIRGASPWLQGFFPTAWIVMTWLIMLGICSLLGPMDPSNQFLLRGGIYICSFVTGRYLVWAIMYVWSGLASGKDHSFPDDRMEEE